MEWKIKPFEEEDGKGYYEIFPDGHPAAGKIRARYLTEPSRKYLDNFTQSPRYKTPEEVQSERKAEFAACKTDAERIQKMAEFTGLK
ncbi:MAG: hypothetical protein AB1599_04295 [Planctomycetota bacterium]